VRIWEKYTANPVDPVKKKQRSRKMSDQDYIKQNDLEFEEQTETLFKGITNHMLEFNLSQAQVDLFGTDKDAFKAALQGHIDAQTAAKTATGLKNDMRTICEKNFRNLATFIQGNPGASNESKQNSGLPIHDTTPSVIVPVQCTDLKATGTQSGTNVLDWKSGGNKPGTIYVIEKKFKDDPEFSYVDVSTSTKYNHKGQTPGVFMLYRIIAKRGDQLSEPSNEASVYGSEG